MKAHFTGEPNGIKPDWRSRPAIDVALVLDLDFSVTVKASLYSGASSQTNTIYCNLWAWGPDRYHHGHGKAGGYGYHKQSAALDAAIRSAGITLTGDEYGGPGPGDGSGSIAGRGEGSMEAALIAIARAISGRRTFQVLWANA